MKSIKILGIPFDFGQAHNGVRDAYHYLKHSGLSQRLNKFANYHDLGLLDLPAKNIQNDDLEIKSCAQASQANFQISDFISKQHLDNNFLLSIGGDHGMALGTIHGILAHDPGRIIVWADAHGDINTPATSPSGNFHGMPLAFLLNRATHKEFDWIKHRLLPQRLILIGPRDLDEGERAIIQELSIQYFSSEDLNCMGAKEVLDIALHRADPEGKAGIHLSFDVDFFDGRDMKSTGTIVKHGPKLEEVFLLGGILGESGRLRSMDLVEFNPGIGTESEISASCHLILDFLETVVKSVFAVSMSSLERSRNIYYKSFNKNIFQRENP